MEKKTNSPRKQKEKKGKVIRISPDLWKIISKMKRKGDTNDSVLKRLTGGEASDVTRESWFALTEAGTIHKTRAEARGFAVLFYSRRGKSGQIERPVEVRRVV